MINTKTCIKQSTARNQMQTKGQSIAKDKGIDFHHVSHAKKSQTRSQVRLDLCAIHLKSQTAALAKTLKGPEQGVSVPSVL